SDSRPEPAPPQPDWGRYWLAVLRRLAGEGRAEPDVLLETLRAAVASGSSRHHAHLLQALDSVAQEAMLAAEGPHLPPLPAPRRAGPARDDQPPPLSEWETATADIPDPVARLVGFLQTGSLPPPGAGAAGDTPRGWLDEALAEHPERLWAALKAAATRPEVIRRLLHYLPSDSLFRLIAALSPEHGEFIRGYLLSGGALETDGRLPVNQRKRAKQIHWQAVLAALLGRRSPDVSPSRFLVEMSGRVAEQMGLSVPVYLERMLESARGKAAVETRYAPVVEALAEVCRRYPAAVQDAGRGSPDEPDSEPARDEIDLGTALDVLRPVLERRSGSLRERLSQAPDGVPREPKPAAPVRHPSRSPAAPKPEAGPPPAWPYRSPESDPGELPPGESFYVDNAGVVLLWPFLSRYFQMLGLLEQNQFRDDDARSRAAYLLQYLATGAMDAPEPVLLLNKILCGAKTAGPLEPQLPPTEPERQLSEQLLYGVTQNWSKLRNTSIAGLRESFLQREGRLRRSDESWTLTVGGKAYDMLLDSLPWNISTLRLGWMDQPLFVKWR
ncbi:contractile injection system tape measure protein, partial [Methylomagnum sp.]